MVEVNLPFSMKVVLGILVILSLSIAGAVDATPNYKYEEDFSLEKASSVPDDVEPVEFDTLSSSEQNAVLSGLSENKEVEVENLPEEFGREGYISINGQMYEYEVSPLVDRHGDGVMIEAMLSIILFILCVPILLSILKEAEDRFNLTEDQYMTLIIVGVVILGLFPLAQFMAFSMDDPGGKVVYVGAADSTEDAVEYSSLSMEQQAYVSTLTVSDQKYTGLGSGYGNPPELSTEMDDKELQELDTVVMKVNGETEYHNFVTMQKETNSLGLTDVQESTMYFLLGYYICLSLLLAVGIFEDGEEVES